MKELAKHWWILSLRALLAFALALSIAFVPGLMATFILESLAFPFMLTAFAVYIGLDSLVLTLLARQFPTHSTARWLIFAQACSSIVIAACLLTVWFERATLWWFVLLSIIQAAVTGTYELAIAHHFKRHAVDAEATFIIGGVSLVFSFILIILRYSDVHTILNWIASYALFFGASMLWFSLRLRRVVHKWLPESINTAA
jgi:hypothetical protein